jgi:formate hydrogenlyase subunit 3/multisubunit Na+/H+ antiporter MnhD subunit
MKWLAMFEPQDLWVALYIILIFVAFISGLFLGASFSPARERKAREPWHARLAAEGELRHDGKLKSLPALVVALVVVSAVIVLDYFKGPLFPDVFYCLNDGGSQITTMCTAHRNLIAKSP